jgi:RNA polymerase sigma factor (sigma-70 family)
MAGDTVTGTTLGPYLARIGEVPLLSPEGEVDLAKRARAGVLARAMLTPPARPSPERRARLLRVVAEGERASDLLVRANLRLVVSMANRYRGRGLDLADVIQEGNLGLLKAVERFDHARGFRFSTYASWWIRQSITRGLADRGRAVRLPVHAHETLVKLAWVELELFQRLGREPTEPELAEALGVRVERLRDIRAAGRTLRSLDAPSGPNGEHDLGSTLPDRSAVDPAQLAASPDVRATLLAAMARLELRERTVLELRFGILDGQSRTLDQIGEVFGVTRERIRQIELRGLRKLAHRRLDHLLGELSA